MLQELSDNAFFQILLILEKYAFLKLPDNPATNGAYQKDRRPIAFFVWQPGYRPVLPGLQNNPL
jgi:hypothetical protein